MIGEAICVDWHWNDVRGFETLVGKGLESEAHGKIFDIGTREYLYYLFEIDLGWLKQHLIDIA